MSKFLLIPKARITRKDSTRIRFIDSKGGFAKAEDVLEAGEECLVAFASQSSSRNLFSKPGTRDYSSFPVHETQSFPPQQQSAKVYQTHRAAWIFKSRRKGMERLPLLPNCSAFRLYEGEFHIEGRNDA